MPHIIIEYCDALVAESQQQPLLDQVFATVESCGLFDAANIKLRMHPLTAYKTESGRLFLHIQCRIHQGRSTTQKKQLSQSLVDVLAGLMPAHTVITAEIVDMETSSYSKQVVS